MALITTPLSITTISDVHHDVLEHNILNRLDGLSLATLSCTSSYFNALSSENSLWRNMCTSTWPSLSHPHIHHLISSVPNGYYRLFSDSFPLLTPHDQPKNPNRSTLPPELISAVDIWYQSKLIFSKVIETETKSGDFLRFPFRVDLFDPNEVLPTSRVKVDQRGDDSWLSLRELEENLTISWIIYNPITKKSANFSSTKPVSSQRHWLPGEYDIEYATILGCEREGYMECKIVVTCGGLEHGELRVRDACMKLKDMGGKYLNGKESLVSLVNAIGFGKRKRGENEGKRTHEEFIRKKIMRCEKKTGNNRVLEITFGVGLSVVYLIAMIIYLVLHLWTLVRVKIHRRKRHIL